MQENHGAFGLSIGCMDGREKRAVSNWIRTNFLHIKHIDQVKAPGTVGLLAGTTKELPEIDGHRMDVEHHLGVLKFNALVSVKFHHPELIVVSGHDQCAGNPVDKEAHFDHITKAIETVKGWGARFSSLPIYGLYAYQKEDGVWEVELVTAHEPNPVHQQLVA